MSATTLTKTSTPTSQTITQQPLLASRLGIGVLAVVAIAAIFIYGLAAFQVRSRPFPGMLITHTATVNAAKPTGSATWPALAAGMKRQDHIIAVNEQSLASDAATVTVRDTARAYRDIVSGMAVDDPITVRFLRQEQFATIDPTICGEAVNGIAECQVTFTMAAFPEVDFLSYFVLPYAAALIIIAIGLVVLRYRANRPEGLLVASFAFLSGIYAAGLFDVGTTSLLTSLWLMAAVWLAGALVTLGLIFPRRLRIVRQYPFFEYVPTLLSTVIGIYLIYRFFNPANAWDYEMPQLATNIAILGLPGILGLTFIQRRRASTPVARDQSNTILIGFTLMLVPALLWLGSQVFIAQTQNTFIFNFEALMPLFIFPNAASAYVVLQYRRFDTDKIISQSITYSIMGFALVIAMFLLAFGGSLLAFNLFGTSNINILSIALVIFLMVLAFTPLRNRLQARIDAVYFRKKHNLQSQVEAFSQKLTILNDFGSILTEFCRVLDQTIAPAAIFIYLQESAGNDYVAYHGEKAATDVRFKAASPVIKLLTKADNAISLQPGEAWPHELWGERSRLQLLRVRILVGMQGTNKLNGFLMLGPSRSGQITYDYDEVHFVENLVGQLAIATERSQVIESLEKRVRESDVLSRISQAVNFTIEFDDLLELIYAQTSRLVDAPYFFIALYEEQIEQMYFAFLLENDERAHERENVRWSLSNDLFSEVVRTSRAIRVENFMEEMKKRGASHNLVSQDFKAWIGVPLDAGRHTLGVMAAAKAKDAKAYSDEEFKFFNDIGALAATSIDKANLFTQTMMRERQLTVLNDISRRLVATESDVEKLLEIIVQSAVEILNAEAGSLLLTADDDSQDLIFRVVFGGAGEDLLGSRVPHGTGLVGQVMKDGTHVIVNDAEHDPRHAQDVADFVSKSLLAVPLSTKSGPIGVLEVLNKKDGTVFVEDDASLLITFAGQAAVAIENARLFQLTDQQLAQRVQELETLERLDAQLNRTLDLNEVAEVTVRSAMNILKADGGVLGIVNEDAAVLEIIVLEGYDETLFQKEDNGLLTWPLDRGIIGRVIRSHQADLVMDVHIDPDYDGGLEGSNSQITLPMVSGDQLNAILVLEKNSYPRFSLPDWGFAQRIAEHASIAIANAQFYAALRIANESKSEFMGFAAHELKNPLSPIIGWADLMRQGAAGPMTEQQENFINVIYSNAKRMETIISDLRDVAKEEANQFEIDPEPMNIYHAVIETLRPFVRAFDEKNQDVVNNVPEDLPHVMGEETRLIQVLTNLVSNASKYSGEDTTVTISGKLVENYVDRRGEARGKMVQISVTDQGIGMSEEDQNRLFKERYFRSTNQEALDKPGTGLGMTLSKSIMEKHKGEIWIESELGLGSTFHIVIPVVVEEIPKTLPRRPEPASD